MCVSKILLETSLCVSYSSEAQLCCCIEIIPHWRARVRTEQAFQPTVWSFLFVHICRFEDVKWYSAHLQMSNHVSYPPPFLLILLHSPSQLPLPFPSPSLSPLRPSPSNVQHEAGVPPDCVWHWALNHPFPVEHESSNGYHKWSGVTVLPQFSMYGHAASISSFSCRYSMAVSAVWLTCVQYQNRGAQPQGVQHRGAQHRGAQHRGAQPRGWGLSKPYSVWLPCYMCYMQGWGACALLCSNRRVLSMRVLALQKWRTLLVHCMSPGYCSALRTR